jgi:hypothetical protein
MMKNLFSKVRSLHGHFMAKPAKIRPHACSVNYFLSTNLNQNIFARSTIMFLWIYGNVREKNGSTHRKSAKNKKDWLRKRHPQISTVEGPQI